MKLKRNPREKKSGGVAALQARTAVTQDPRRHALDEISVAVGIGHIGRQRDEEIEQFHGDIAGAGRYVRDPIDHGIDLARFDDLRDDSRCGIARDFIGARQEQTQAVAARAESECPRFIRMPAVRMHIQRYEFHAIPDL